MEEGLGYSLAEFRERIRRGPPAIEQTGVRIELLA
jgi:hypothetical protein